MHVSTPLAVLSHGSSQVCASSSGKVDALAISIEDGYGVS